MRYLGRALIVGVVILTASPSQAANWSLGANLGLRILNTENQSGTIAAITLPGDGIFAREPGLRLGFTGESRTHEFFVDTGIVLLSETGFSFHAYQFTGNYQYNFTPARSPSPYITAGAGFLGEGDDSASSTLSSLGGGLGLQYHVASGHGTVRTEFRLDHFGSDKSAGARSVDAFGLKLGFDLWMK